jgi:hypothetical protein
VSKELQQHTTVLGEIPHFHLAIRTGVWKYWKWSLTDFNSQVAIFGDWWDWGSPTGFGH